MSQIIIQTLAADITRLKAENKQYEHEINHNDHHHKPTYEADHTIRLDRLHKLIAANKIEISRMTIEVN
jgi:hypothetical protein